MTDSKKILSLKEKLDLDYQMLAAELDTEVNSIRVLSNVFLDDCIQSDRFEKLFNDIKSEWNLIISFDDNTDIYEFNYVVVVLHETIYNKHILFDKYYCSRIEAKFNSYI